MFSDRRIRTSLVAISTDLLLTVLKVVLAVLTGSAALKADAFHSATDFIVSIVLLVGIIFRIRKENEAGDQNNQFGRLIESVLAIFVALIILYVPYEIISEIGTGTTNEIDNLTIGILGTVLIILIVFFISRFKLFVGRETDSIALEADGYHSMVDVFTSIAVLVSLIGYMVGINLDEIIAVVIAIMIAVTGLELLVSGISSLVNKTEFDQLSFYEYVAKLYSNTLGKETISKYWRAFFSEVYGFRYLLMALGLFIYLLSGFKVISEGSIGKKTQLGKIVSVGLEPGLHYALPWPFGNIERYEHGSVYAVNLGTRSDDLMEGKQRIWTEVKEKSLRHETANYYVTSDEQLLDMTVSVFYRISDSYVVTSTISAHRTFVEVVSSYSLNQFVLSHSLESLLSKEKTELTLELGAYIQAGLEHTGAQIDVVDIQFQTFRPPALVIGAYRDVINAQQEKLQTINKAVADRLKALPLSRANYVERISGAESTSMTKLLEAEGDIAKISRLTEVQNSNRKGFEFNAYINMLDEALLGKRFLIKDERLSNADLRLWNVNSE